MDTRTQDQIEYEKYLHNLPRPERRRILKDHMKRIEMAATQPLRDRDAARYAKKHQKPAEVQHAMS